MASEYFTVRWWTMWLPGKLRKAGRRLRGWANRVYIASSITRFLMRRISWVAVAPISVLTILTVTLVVPPICWLPEVRNAGTVLTGLLTAQAAIAALTLAVTIFVMQGANSRRDVDDRMYREYIRRSWVKPIFWNSLVALGVTAAILIDEDFTGWANAIAISKPGLCNLPLVAVVAFLANLVLPYALLERAIQLSRPAHWGNLKRDVNKRDVHVAVQAFLQRFRRTVASRDATDVDLTNMFPGPDEGSADESIRALLDEARRAMAERRQGEFWQSLESIEEVVEDSMAEIEKTGIKWAPPGQQPEWPPLRELGRNLYSFRQEVINEGNLDYLLMLLRLDYWLFSTGAHQRCGDLFTAGLDGYRRNYQIALRNGSGFREMLRSRVWMSAPTLLREGSPDEMFPYAVELVRHQELFLSDALDSDRADDYDQLHREFQSLLQNILPDWVGGRRQVPESGNLYQRVQEGYRIVLMGLAGRALILAEDGRIADPAPYLNIARGAYARAGQLADDVVQALGREASGSFSLWSQWEMEGSPNYEAHTIAPERYPLTFFTVRLLELTTTEPADLNLQGRASQVSAWFVQNAERLEIHVTDEADVTSEQRRQLATEALRSAQRRDEVAQDYEIIGRELSVDRVSTFKSEVYTTAFAENPLEQLFQQAGAYVSLSGRPEAAPQERGFCGLVPKGFLTESPENARIGYARLEGDRWGRGLSDDVMKGLCEELESAATVIATLDSPEAFLRVIDQEITEINPSGEIAVVLAGYWRDMEFDLAIARPEGYVMDWQVPENERIGEIARYNDHPILRGPRDGEKRIYVVDLATWGRLVRSQFEDGQDLKIEILPVSDMRARELLEANPSHFENEPDGESKLRKLRTCVELNIGARHEFRDVDPSRARRIIAIG